MKMKNQKINLLNNLRKNPEIYDYIAVSIFKTESIFEKIKDKISEEAKNDIQETINIHFDFLKCDNLNNLNKKNINIIYKYINFLLKNDDKHWKME